MQDEGWKDDSVLRMCITRLENISLIPAPRLGSSQPPVTQAIEDLTALASMDTHTYIVYTVTDMHTYIHMIKNKSFIKEKGRALF